jgi:hypothetical protein
MKKIIALVVCLPALSFNLALAQPAPAPNQSPEPPPDKTGRYVWVQETNSLPKFDLKFPGGTPEQLVKAIEKVTDKPLNTVIPDDCKDLKIPAFLVKNVTVAQLFSILKSSSTRKQRYMVLDSKGNASFDQPDFSYGFTTDGPPSQNSIWYFYRDQETPPWQVVAPKVVRFYQLEPYLDAGYKVDEITTAVETGWKMLGVTNPPAMSYYNDTKVLIVVGEEEKADMVNDLLQQLRHGKPNEKQLNSQAESSGK